MRASSTNLIATKLHRFCPLFWQSNAQAVVLHAARAKPNISDTNQTKNGRVRKPGPLAPCKGTYHSNTRHPSHDKTANCRSHYSLWFAASEDEPTCATTVVITQLATNVHMVPLGPWAVIESKSKLNLLARLHPGSGCGEKARTWRTCHLKPESVTECWLVSPPIRLAHLPASEV
jgi:hypothetical protein